jgi:hypothetical protein
MGMYGRLRHIPPAELAAAKKNPAAFYRELFGITGEAKPGEDAFKNALGLQMGKALRTSGGGAQLRQMPEVKRVLEAAATGKSASLEDQQAMVAKFMEILQKAKFRPDFSALTSTLPQKTKVPDGLSLEKSWHSLHFLLTGKVWEAGDGPLGSVMLGGTELPDSENVMGYGPAKYFSAAEVKKISKALDAYPIEECARDFDEAAAEQAKIYCPSHAPEELVFYFTSVRDYYREAVKSGHAMLTWIE